MSESRMIHEFPASCSCLALTSKQGRSYWFRTCDLHTSVWEAGAHVVSFPARQSIQLAGGPAQARYALLGVTYNDRDTWLLDGINSQGLTGGLLLLEEGTSVPAAEEGRAGVMGMELVTALLASCRNGLLYVPLIQLLPGLLGLSGVAMSQPAADFLTFLVSIPFQIWFFRHKLRG